MSNLDGLPIVKRFTIAEAGRREGTARAGAERRTADARLAIVAMVLLATMGVGCKPRDAPTERAPVPAVAAVPAVPAVAPNAGTRAAVVKAASSAARPMPAMPHGFLKGQLHAHSSQSADSSTSPRDVHAWYEAHGYDFVVFTDHNTVTDTDDTQMLTLRGAELTRNVRDCEPPSEPPGSASACPLHMNVLFASAAVGPVPIDPAGMTSRSRRDVYQGELRLAQALGGVAMLNHPNMLYAADQATVLDLAQRGLVLLEVGNQSWDADNAGDATHPSTEALWDSVLGHGVRVFATVTDDAHFYGDLASARAHGETPFPGDLGFVVVHAEKTAAQIRAAVVRGDFYGSTGVVFGTYELGPAKIALTTSDGAPVVFEAIGKGGVVLQRVRAPRFDLALGPAERPYVRVRATRDDGAAAWTQPVFMDAPARAR